VFLECVLCAHGVDGRGVRDDTDDVPGAAGAVCAEADFLSGGTDDRLLSSVSSSAITRGWARCLSEETDDEKRSSVLPAGGGQGGIKVGPTLAIGVASGHDGIGGASGVDAHRFGGVFGGSGEVAAIRRQMEFRQGDAQLVVVGRGFREGGLGGIALGSVDGGDAGVGMKLSGTAGRAIDAHEGIAIIDR
jgi:hypothetical protein